MELTENTVMDPEIAGAGLDAVDGLIITAIHGGLPITARPYAELAEALGIGEKDVMMRIGNLVGQGIIKRLGVVVRHHEVGYRANAMVVWDVPDGEAAAYAERMRGHSGVTLCYRRPRQPPVWPYNLFCMIHGRDRQQVLDHLRSLIERHRWQGIQHEVLFSRRRFKQRGARYHLAEVPSAGGLPAFTPAECVNG